MAVYRRDANGRRVAVLPSHDPDEMDEALARELAYERAKDAVITAARQVWGNVDAVAGDEYLITLRDAVTAFDAAQAAWQAQNRAEWREAVGDVHP